MRPSSGVGAASALAKMHLNPRTAAAFWSAPGHLKAPPLNTTYGNFTTVNSVTRFTFTIPANTYVQFIHGFTGNAVRTYKYQFTSLTAPGTPNLCAWMQQQLSPINTVPLDIRPLRMTVRMRNTTQNLNLAGSVKSALVPQSLAMSFEVANGLSPAAVQSLWNLVASNPHATTKTGVEMTRGHTFVMPPSSYVAYNSYVDWTALSAACDNGAIINMLDWNLLSNGPHTYPYTPISDFPFAEIPTNHFMLTNFETNPLAQTYEFETYCQDGVRYPANTLAAAVATRPATVTLSDGVVQQTAVTASAKHVDTTESSEKAASEVRRAMEAFEHMGEATMAASAFAGPYAPEVRAGGAIATGIGSFGSYMASRWE